MGDDLRTWMMRVFLGVLTLVAAGCMTTRVALGPQAPGTPARIVAGRPTPPAEARKRQGVLGRPLERPVGLEAITLAAPPPPFAPPPGATGAGYVSCPPVA